MPAPAAPAVASPAPAKKLKGKLILAGGAVALLVAGAGGGWWVTQSRAAAAEAARNTKPPALYHALSPAFVVNLTDADGSRFLQADVQLMTRDPETQAALEQHAPAIRNRLLLLFGAQSAQHLNGRAGKEALQGKALAEVRATLKAERAPDRIEALYFTSLVIQ